MQLTLLWDGLDSDYEAVEFLMRSGVLRELYDFYQHLLHHLKIFEKEGVLQICLMLQIFL